MAKEMRHALLAFALVVAAVLAAMPALAQPLQQEPRPVIAQPEQDAAVRGVVQIIGTAVHPQFQRYELYYAPWPVPSDQSWIFIGDAKFQQQPLGLLGTWDSRAVPDGAYALRVRLVKQDGNYLDSDSVRVFAANTRPIEQPSPTPTETATPEAEAVVTEPTPAAEEIVAPTVEVPLPTPEPTATPEPETMEAPAPDTGPDEPASPEASGDAFNLDALIEIARKSAMYTAGFFVALGAFFAVKAAAVWMWHRIRP
jgi:hypothetical protein